MDNFAIDGDVLDFISSRFTPELSDELIRAFELFYAFNLQNADTEMMNIISQYSEYDSSTLNDLFLKQVKEYQEQIFQAHHIQLNNYDDIYISNELLSGLLLVQSLDDYTPILVVLESNEFDQYEQFAEIFSDITVLSYYEVINNIKSIEDGFFKTLMQYAYQQQKQSTFVNSENIPLDKIKLFKTFLGTNKAIGLEILNHQVPVGLSVVDYIPYIDNHFKEQNNIPQLALDILSILMISKEGYNLPMIAYRKYSSHFIADIAIIQKVDIIISQILNDFEHFKLNQKEKK